MTARCVRANVATWHAPVEPGHDFCPPCLAWLRGDEDEDPLGEPTPAPAKLSSLGAPYPPDGIDDEDWYDYLAVALAACS